MILKAHEVSDRTVQSGSYRLFLFMGPDESASRALAARVAGALGPDLERIDLGGAELKADPARLADESAAFAMFGGRRLIVVDRAGEESLAAVEALFATPGGNPVVLLAGDLKKGSKLRKAAEAHPQAATVASYELGGRDVAAIDAMARAVGLRPERGVALRLIEDNAGSRGAIEQELAKFALYADASVDDPHPLDHGLIDAVGAGAESDLTRIVDCVADGDAAGLEQELGRLRAEGGDGIGLLRAVERRLVLLARLRAQVEAGRPAAAVVQSAGVFWKEKDAVVRELGRWRGPLIAKALGRLLAAEWDVMRGGGPGPLAAEAELFAICRQAARLR